MSDLYHIKAAMILTYPWQDRCQDPGISMTGPGPRSWHIHDRTFVMILTYQLQDLCQDPDISITGPMSWFWHIHDRTCAKILTYPWQDLCQDFHGKIWKLYQRGAYDADAVRRWPDKQLDCWILKELIKKPEDHIFRFLSMKSKFGITRKYAHHTIVLKWPSHEIIFHRFFTKQPLLTPIEGSLSKFEFELF